MGIYSELNGKLITAATQHFKTVGALNDWVIPYVKALATHLGVDPSRLEVGRVVDDAFVVDSHFPPNDHRNEMTFVVLAEFHLGNGEVFQPAIGVTFLAAADGLHVTVEGHEERLCGPLASHPSAEQWQITFVDFANSLDERVSSLIEQISL